MMLWLLLAASPSSAPSLKELSILYVSSRHGAVAPCHCDTSPLGGVDRQATAIAEARKNTKNLIVIVWDNGVYGTTGGQDTATVHGTNLAGAATSMGISNVATAETIDGLARVLERVDAESGPWVVVAKVAENMPAVKPPLDCVYIKQRFMAAIGSPEAATSGGPA